VRVMAVRMEEADESQSVSLRQIWDIARK